MATISRTPVLTSPQLAAKESAKALAAQKAAATIAAAAMARGAPVPQPTQGLILPIIGEVTPTKVVVGGLLLGGLALFLKRKK